MKRIYITFLIALFAFSAALAQSKFNVGGGYFGHTLTYPGIILEAEWETNYTEKSSLPIRVDVGVFVHKRYQTGIFTDINYGFRQYFNSGLFLEESIGAGTLIGILSNDATYEVSSAGEVSEISDFSSIDFMPSITLGIGYNVTKNREKANYIWLRSKMYWQLPHKTTSTYNMVIQVGFTHRLSK